MKNGKVSDRVVEREKGRVRARERKRERVDQKAAYASIDVNQLVQSAYLTRKKVCSERVDQVNE